ncbi:glycosyltransferase family 87 protein [Actinomadura macrotermitis]|uniref:glycosyltransferase family 87 protein n=1 Tax=Actinomadura macrotermitis TaxID=2585200 RepID=UPI00188653DC|nr:glycosyltransferase family 87 protein [Actinomadura macrotermitis]
MRTKWRDKVMAGWVLSRVLLVVILLVPVYLRLGILGDVKLYEEWSRILVTGHLPGDDPSWQYPPLSALVFVLPRIFGGGGVYGFMFMLGALTVDLLVLRMLMWKGRPRSGAWYWVAGIFLLGPIVYFRYDLFATAPVVLALLVISRRRIFGTLAAVGALLKVWPVLLLLAVPRSRAAVQTIAAFAVTAALVLAILAGTVDGAWGFLQQQEGRGLEVEALAATPFQVARSFGWQGVCRLRYGAWELVGPGIATAATASVVVNLVAFVLLAVAVWRHAPRRWTPAFGCDAVLAAVLVAVVTSRVLSPQYLIWLLGIGAVCAVDPRTRQRPVLVLLLVATALTQLEFPLLWSDVMAGKGVGTAVLVARNLILVAATVLAVARVWRGPAAEAAAAPEPVRDERVEGLALSGPGS